MNRLFYVVTFIFLPAYIIGCSEPEKTPFWEDTKITDLAPAKGEERPSQLKTTNFDVGVFEMQAEKIDTLEEVMQILYSQPVRFNEPAAFSTNSFSAGFAPPQMWNHIAELLLGAETKKIGTISLLLTDGVADNAKIDVINEQTIFYASETGLMNGVTLGPGTLALRIKADKIFTIKGVRYITITPVFLPPPLGPIGKLANREKTEEFFFNGCAFQWKASPGDFVILGPTKYIDNKITLAGSFFSKPEGSWSFADDKPVIRFFVLVCTRIVD